MQLQFLCFPLLLLAMFLPLIIFAYFLIARSSNYRDSESYHFFSLLEPIAKPFRYILLFPLKKYKTNMMSQRD